jgi:hypothetical protein
MEVKFTFRTVDFGVGIRKGDTRMKEWVDQRVATNLKNGKLDGIYRCALASHTLGRIRGCIGLTHGSAKGIAF